MTLEQLADRVSAAIWNLHPGWAVAVGRHQYDGQVPDLSAEAIEAGLERLVRLREQLVGLAGPAPEQSVDREVLLGVVDRERFDLERVVRWRRDPSWYLEPLDISVYLERDYAPAGLRLEHAAAVLGEAGPLLSAARANLGAAIPATRVEAAAGRARDLARRLVAQAEWAPAAGAVPGEAAWLRETAGLAAAELEAFAAWLEVERLAASTEELGLGPEGLEEWLRADECLDWTAADLASAGAAGLVDDRAALALAEAAVPAVPAPGVDRVESLRLAIEEACRFVRESGRVCVPDAPVLEVRVGSRPDVDEAGWLQPAGAYDDPATRPVLYLSPGGEAGPGALDDLAVALACPGRLLAVSSAAGAVGEVRRRFPSRGFLGGWALYAGDLMAEWGFWADHPAGRVAALRRAIREDCRLIAVAGMHRGALSLGDAAALFCAQAGLDAAGARSEALGCSVDPGRASGSLGRVAFRRLRQRWEGRPGGQFATFPDWLLSASALPLGMLDRLLP